jgi:hypothetical protein
VNPLTMFMRSLGNPGALANARAMLDARYAEDWLVHGLTRRLESSGTTTSPAAGAATTAA